MCFAGNYILFVTESPQIGGSQISYTIEGKAKIYTLQY